MPGNRAAHSTGRTTLFHKNRVNVRDIARILRAATLSYVVCVVPENTPVGSGRVVHLGLQLVSQSTSEKCLMDSLRATQMGGRKQWDGGWNGEVFRCKIKSWSVSSNDGRNMVSYREY